MEINIETIDPLNLRCGCSFNFNGEQVTMCEDAGRIKNQGTADEWYEHYKDSQPLIKAMPSAYSFLCFSHYDSN